MEQVFKRTLFFVVISVLANSFFFFFLSNDDNKHQVVLLSVIAFFLGTPIFLNYVCSYFITQKYNLLCSILNTVLTIFNCGILFFVSVLCFSVTEEEPTVFFGLFYLATGVYLYAKAIQLFPQHLSKNSIPLTDNSSKSTSLKDDTILDDDFFM